MITSDDVQAALAALNDANGQLYRARVQDSACHAAFAKSTANVTKNSKRARAAFDKYYALRDAYLDQEAKEPAS